MSDINSISISGRLGANCELRYTSSNNPVANLRVASGRVFSSNGDKQEETTWVRVTVWGKLAEACYKHLGKGSRVGLTGRLQQVKYTDKDQTAHTYLQVVANEVSFLETRPRSDSPADGPTDDLPPSDD